MQRLTSWLGNRPGNSSASNSIKARRRQRRPHSSHRPLLETLETRLALDNGFHSVLWGVDEDDGELFSIADYTSIAGGAAAAGLTSYGNLLYDANGQGNLKEIGSEIASFTLDSDGNAYMVLGKNLPLGGGQSNLKDPVLLKFNVFNAVVGGPNVVEVVGTIAINKFKSGEGIGGVALHPDTGELYAVYRAGGAKTADKLLIIDKNDASVVQVVGTLKNKVGGKTTAVDDGESLEFDAQGRLFITDGKDDQLYEVDASNAKILAVVVANTRTGTGLPSSFVEALSYDDQLGQFLANDDDSNNFIIYTEGGGVTTLGTLPGLTDVEGMEFLPPFSDGGGGEEPARVPAFAQGLKAAQISSAQINASVVDEIMQEVGSTRKGRRG